MADKHFDPAKYLTNLKGSDYLEVKWRLVWLRHEHPNAVIETQLIEHSDTHAIFKATVDIPLEGGAGGGSATGWGSETKGDFKDYIEKAETKALGRALGALGFGTQFAPDLDDGSASGRVVDAPVTRPAPARDRSTSRNIVPETPQASVRNETAKQVSDIGAGETIPQTALKALWAKATERAISDEDLHAIARKRTGKDSLKALTVEEGRTLYRLLSAETDEGLQHEVYQALSHTTTLPEQDRLVPDHDLAERARR